MKEKTNAVLDKVLRRERNRKIKLYTGFAILIVALGAVVAYSQFRMAENIPVDKPMNAMTMHEQSENTKDE